MTKILLINPNQWGRGITHLWVASHSSLLRSFNHNVELFDATFYNDWSKDVLQKVQNTADFLIIHDYFRRKPNPNNVTYQEMLNSISEVQQNVSNVNNMVTNYTSKPSGYFPIAMTEFNSKTGEREISMANAIFISQVLCEQIKNNIGMSLLWSFQNGLDSHGGDHGMTARNSTISS